MAAGVLPHPSLLKAGLLKAGLLKAGLLKAGLLKAGLLTADSRFVHTPTHGRS